MPPGRGRGRGKISVNKQRRHISQDHSNEPPPAKRSVSRRTNVPNPTATNNVSTPPQPPPPSSSRKSRKEATDANNQMVSSSREASDTRHDDAIISRATSIINALLLDGKSDIYKKVPKVFTGLPVMQSLDTNLYKLYNLRKSLSLARGPNCIVRCTIFSKVREHSTSTRMITLHSIVSLYS
jgi:hypothetical protein